MSALPPNNGSWVAHPSRSAFPILNQGYDGVIAASPSWEPSGPCLGPPRLGGGDLGAWRLGLPIGNVKLIVGKLFFPWGNFFPDLRRIRKVPRLASLSSSASFASASFLLPVTVTKVGEPLDAFGFLIRVPNAQAHNPRSFHSCRSSYPRTDACERFFGDDNSGS